MAWNKTEHLQWNFFLGVIDQNSPFHAHTSVGDTIIYHLVNYTNGRFEIEFSGFSLFDMNRSWVKPAFKNEKLLQHEQGHFDISEFYWRQLLKALKHHTFTYEYKSEISVIQKEELKECAAMQALYDEQTQHSKNRLFQKKWDDYLKDILDNNYKLEDALERQPQRD